MRNKYNEEVLQCPGFETKCIKTIEEKQTYVDWLELDEYNARQMANK